MTPDEEELEAAHFMLWQTEIDDPTVPVQEWAAATTPWMLKEVVAVLIISLSIIGTVCIALSLLFALVWWLAG